MQFFLNKMPLYTHTNNPHHISTCTISTSHICQYIPHLSRHIRPAVPIETAGAARAYYYANPRFNTRHEKNASFFSRENAPFFSYSWPPSLRGRGNHMLIESAQRALHSFSLPSTPPSHRAHQRGIIALCFDHTENPLFSHPTHPPLQRAH